MKIEVTSQAGISFSVELTEDEREGIKNDLEEHLDEIKELTNSGMTDSFLKGIKQLI